MSAVFGSTGTLISESESFITSVVDSGTFWTVTWDTGKFGVAPAVFVTDASSSIKSLDSDAVTTTGCVIQISDNINAQFSIMVMRQDSDIKSASILAAIPTQKVAIITHQEAQNTDGGDSSTSFTQRTLNTVQGDTEIVSLSANRFTTTATSGKYLIEWEALVWGCSGHNSRLVVDPAGTPTYFYGTSVKSVDSATEAGSESVPSTGQAIVIVTGGTQTFEIQSISSAARTGWGYGSGNNFAPERYMFVKVTKLK